MSDADTDWPRANEPAVADPFENIEADRLNQEIARQYVLLARTLGPPFRG